MKERGRSGITMQVRERRNVRRALKPVYVKIYINKEIKEAE
jgi:hypothetical protein